MTKIERAWNPCPSGMDMDIKQWQKVLDCDFYYQQDLKRQNNETKSK